MALSIKEYCSSDPQQLICVVRIQQNNNIPRAIDALKNISHCVYVAQTSADLVVAASCNDCEADLFLADLVSVVLNFPFEADIEETRFGCIDPLTPTKTFILEKFTIAPPELLADHGCGVGNTLYLEYGTIFGSGQHPSTRLTVRALEGIALEGGFPEQVLDVGCGSGILTFISSRLGAERVLGLDICEKSIEVAQKNMVYNQMEDKVRFFCGVLADVPGRFDLIVANISPSVLFELIDLFPHRLSPKGKVVLSGLHSGQTESIISQMVKVSCEHQNSYSEGSWRALTFQRISSL